MSDEHSLSDITSPPTVGGRLLPVWMEKHGATCRCGLDIVGNSPDEVYESWRIHRRLVIEQRERTVRDERLVDRMRRLATTEILPTQDQPDTFAEGVAEMRARILGGLL